jgi:hypothetical protein
VAEGGAARARGGAVTRKSLEWPSGGRGFTTRGRGGGGDDAEAYGGIGKAQCG